MFQRRKQIAVSARLARTLKPNERFLTSMYRKAVAKLCISAPFRSAWDVFNEMTLRKEQDHCISLSTFIQDFIGDGQAVRKAKQALAAKILEDNGMDPKTLKFKNGTWPEAWQEPKDIMITVTGNDPIPALIHSWDPANPKLEGPDMVIEEEEATEDQKKEKERILELYSEPDTDSFIPRRKRRTTRYEAPSEDIEWICNGYVDWLNNNTKHDECKILQTWILEKGSSRTVYLSIDAVYVVQQSETHVKGGKPEMKLKKDRIGHWNIAVEFDNCRYYITASTRFEAFQQLFAVLISNNLMDRHFVFFADGEKEIFDDVETYFAGRNSTLMLDWYHIVEKVFQRLSSALIHKMVPDPRSPAENYKQKSRQDEKKKQKDTALSVLYARRVCSILWVGNVAVAKEYLQHIDPKLIKNQDAIDKLIQYLDNKKEWITCYALRKRAGLRNSSNGSE